MKTQTRHLIFILIASGPAFGATSATAGTPAVPPVQISVDVPASISLLHSDDLSEALASSVQSAFRHDGYLGPLTFLSWSDVPKPDAPRLEINLIDWRTTPTRFVDCTFTARFVTPGATRDLGLVSGISFATAFRHDPFGRADDFQAAAEDAADQLYRELATQKLLPAPGY